MGDLDAGFWTSLVADGLIASATVFLLAFGLFVTYGMFRVINMAHGDMVMLGAYIASLLQSMGAGFAVATLGAMALVGATAFAMDQICIGRMREGAPLATLLATWGFGVVISQSVRLALGSGGRFVDAPLQGQVYLLGTTYSSYQVALLVLAVALSALAWYVIARTSLGIRIRACIDNRQLAEIRGINTRLLFTGTFAVGGAFAGLAGAVLAPLSAINPSIGSGFSVSSFMTLITGGLGSITGAVFGALVVGGGKSVIGAFTGVTEAKLAILAIVAVILVLRRRDMSLD